RLRRVAAAQRFWRTLLRRRSAAAAAADVRAHGRCLSPLAHGNVVRPSAARLAAASGGVCDTRQLSFSTQSKREPKPADRERAAVRVPRVRPRGAILQFLLERFSADRLLSPRTRRRTTRLRRAARARSLRRARAVSRDVRSSRSWNRRIRDRGARALDGKIA